MGKSNVIQISKMADSLVQALEEFRDLTDEEMKAAVKQTAQSVKKEIRQAAPRRTGRYAKSWTSKITGQNSHKLVYTVYSKDNYQLSHFLENGHRSRNGGFVRAYPHIAPAEENGMKLLEQLFRQALSK